MFIFIYLFMFTIVVIQFSKYQKSVLNAGLMVNATILNIFHICYSHRKNAR